MAAPPNEDFLANATFASGADLALFPQNTGASVADGRASITGAGGRLLVKTPDAKNFGVTVRARAKMAPGLMVVTGCYDNPIADLSPGAKFEIYTNAAGDRSMKLFLLDGNYPTQYVPNDAEVYTQAPCTYPPDEFHDIVMTCRRNGWFVSIDGVIVLWLKALVGPGTLTVATYGRGFTGASQGFSGVVDRIGGTVVLDTLSVSACRNWGDPLNIGLNSTGNTDDSFQDTFTVAGNWDTASGPTVPTTTADTTRRMQKVLAPSTTFVSNGAGVLTCAGVGAYGVLGLDWDYTELDQHGVHWEIATLVGTGQWHLGVQLSSTTIVYLYINCTSLTPSNVLLGYDLGGKSGFTYPAAGPTGSISSGTWIGLRVSNQREASESVRPDAANVLFEVYNYSTGLVICSFYYTSGGSAAKLNGVVMGSYSAAGSTIGGLIVRRRSASFSGFATMYPIALAKTAAPTDVADPILGSSTDNRGHVGAGESIAGSPPFAGRPAVLYRGLDLVTSSTEGG